MLTTTLITKGRVSIHKVVLDAMAWLNGITLAVEQHAHGVLLSVARLHLPSTTPQAVRGRMSYNAPAFVA